MVHSASVNWRLKFLYFFSVLRLEDQTKKLHKDMKKSTEADIGVFDFKCALDKICVKGPL